MTTRKPLTPLLTALVCLIVAAVAPAKEKVYYSDMEHMNITYWNPKYYGFMNFTSRRYSRRDPIHYVSLHYETLVLLGNNVTLDIYVFEFLSNEYRRSFVEMHYKICDLILKDEVIGPFVNQHIPKACPFPKGIYRLDNMSIPDMPLLATFPFRKGRVYVNSTLAGHGRVERMVEGYIDAVIKTRWR